MAYLRGFDNDVFISYWHYDNRPLKKDGGEGWIEKFHYLLQLMLRRRLGCKDPAIWRDVELAGNDYLTEKLVNRVSKVALLVSVLSPGYLNSEWCIRELQVFCKIAEEAGRLRLDEAKGPIFKVLRMPIPPEKLPPELRDLLDYKFYDETTEDEFIPELGKEAEQKFTAGVLDVACDITEVMGLLKQKIEGGAKPAAAAPVIYLAEASSDQKDARNAISRELKERGCVILPDQSLSAAPDFEKAVGDDLARAKLSIHIIGKHYGWIPENAEHSVVHLQTEIAPGRGGDPAFRRLIWLPGGLKVEDDRQRKFIDHLRSDPAIQKSAEFLEGSLEELKEAVVNELTKRRNPAPAPAIARKHRSPRIYLIHDRADEDAVAPIKDFLFSKDFEAIEPSMEVNEAKVRKYHKDNLTLCDAVLIYHGAASDGWLQAKQSDLRKAAGFGRRKPMLGQAIYLAAPETPKKQRFRTLEADVVRNFEAFIPNKLEEFLSKIRKEFSEPA